MTPKQQRAIAALVTEPTITKAAGAVGVTYRTMCRWMEDPKFAAAYRKARREAFGHAIGLVQRYAPVAVNALARVVADNSAPPAARVTNGDYTYSAPTTSAASDIDRLTTFKYDGAGRVVSQKAYLVSTGSSTSFEETAYDYGVSPSTSPASGITSNDLLAKVRYPDRSSGTAGTSSTYSVSYAYNALGEVTGVTDQNGTSHTYVRDALGRVTRDNAGFTTGTTLDTRVQALSATFDAFGRLIKASSLDGTGSSPTVLNEVRFTFTPLWQVASVAQNSWGAATSGGSTRTVNYTYENLTLDYASGNSSGVTGKGNASRVLTMSYPPTTANGSATGSEQVMSFSYRGSGSTDDAISRLTGLALVVPGSTSTGTTINLANYAYLGDAMVARMIYPDARITLDRSLNHDGSRTSGVYPTLDRYGRLLSQMWTDGNPLSPITTSNAGSGQIPDFYHDSNHAGVANRPPIFEEAYTYDAASNRTGRYDNRPGLTDRTDIDYQFSYDGLDRLTQALRGSAHGADSSGNWKKGVGSQNWGLDALGNWSTTGTDRNSDWQFTAYTSSNHSTDFIETRSHNRANEMTMRDPDGSTGYWAGAGNVNAIASYFNYDSAGNMTIGSRSTSSSYKYKHDAWNRLVSVTVSSDVASNPGGGSSRLFKPHKTPLTAQSYVLATLMAAPLPEFSDDSRPDGGGGEGGVGGVAAEEIIADTLISQYEYNALHWRTIRRVDTTTPTPNGLDQERELIYDASWRLIEERVNASYSGTTGQNPQRVRQLFWGARYIDDLIGQRWDRDADGAFSGSTEGVVYAITDAQFSVRAQVDSAGKLVERINYDPYGNARHSWPGDLDGNGSYTYGSGSTTESTAITNKNGKHVYDAVSTSAGAVNYSADADLDRSGVIDSTDLSLAGSSTRAALASGLISGSGSSDLDNIVGYCGYLFDAESGDYTVRARHYSARWGRWLERDPIGYEAGDANLSEYCRSKSIAMLDPVGLYGIDGHYYSTFIAAICAGKKLADAMRLAYYSQFPDQVNWLDAYSLWKSWMTGNSVYIPGSSSRPLNRFWRMSSEDGSWMMSVMKYIHSLRGGAACNVRDCLKKLIQSGSLKQWEVGIITHALEDSYAHSYESSNGTWNLYSAPWGHGWDSLKDKFGMRTCPDRTCNDPGRHLASFMAVCEAYGGNSMACSACGIWVYYTSVIITDPQTAISNMRKLAIFVGFPPNSEFQPTDDENTSDYYYYPKYTAMLHLMEKIKRACP